MREQGLASYAAVSGLLDRVKAAGTGEFSYVELGGVRPNPRRGRYIRVLNCAGNRTWISLAVGRKYHRFSKAIAAGTVLMEISGTFIRGNRTAPVGTVLTIAAAGSEGSPDSVITLEDGMLKRGATGEGLRPRFSILNPELTQTLPPFQTAGHYGHHGPSV